MIRCSLPTALLALLLCGCGGDETLAPDLLPPTEPPFGGTIFIDPDIITAEDPTTFVGLEYVGTGTRTMFDRRAGWITVEPYLFNASYAGSRVIEVQVNPEFGSVEAAQTVAAFYAEVFGRLPKVSLRDVETSWIHQGVNLFGGGNRNLLIHTGQGELYVADGILEETLVHEAAHTSIDADHAASQGWQAAQLADPTFISAYARDHPTREDIAESFLPWLAVRFRSDRISEGLRATIQATVPHRLAYFDEQAFEMWSAR